MNTVDDPELNELQSVYEKLDVEGRRKMLSIAQKLLETQNPSTDANSEDSAKTHFVQSEIK